MTPQRTSFDAIARVARDAYGRLVARLAHRWNDVAAAEDAMGDALASALEHWPTTGVPDSPEAWLTTAAKNRLREAARHRGVVEGAARALTDSIDHREPHASDAPDQRLNLMFACAHPAIDASARTPLMLQAVLGLPAARIAAAFVVSPTSMSQRLVRAKQKIRDARIPFAIPSGPERTERIAAVLDAIYAAFSTDWDDPVGHEDGESLIGEAIFLAEIVCGLLPEDAEAWGLAALMTFIRARARSRFDGDGTFVPLASQDVRLWDRDAIVRAESLLLRASALRQPGPFQLEAAIQSAHCQRLFSGITPWRSILLFYEALNRVEPTLATKVAHAAALMENGSHEAAAAILEGLDQQEVASYQPYWVVSWHVATARGLGDRAAVCAREALRLTRAPALRAHLERQFG